MNTENKKLSKYLQTRKNQGTVILCFKILLDDIIKNGFATTMSKSQINKEFDEKHKKFGIGTFRSDYLLRQSSKSNLNAIGVEPDNSTFYINPEFLVGLEIKDLEQISTEIADHYESITKKQNQFLAEIKSYFKKGIQQRKKFIEELLLNRETDKKGQAFEVTSYAILKAFYKIRGFELNRFSTIYSNDGGIDFTSQKAVYQVTTNLSPRKFEEDLQKVPLKNRIFVYKTSTSSFDISKFDDDLVMDYISADDLIDHLDYLFKKRPERNSIFILNEIVNEFQREYYA